MKQKLIVLIKCLSILLISSAIGLELWNFYGAFAHHQLIAIPRLIFWVERFALVIHFIEGIIALAYAPRQQKAPIPYGIYTFFVGTVGLLELFERAAGKTALGEGDQLPLKL